MVLGTITRKKAYILSVLSCIKSTNHILWYSDNAYGFICPISGYGISVLPILEECVPIKHKKFTEKLIKETRGQAVCYPNFPLPVFYRYAERLSDAEM